MTVANNTKSDSDFFPQCELMTDTFQIIPAGIYTPPLARTKDGAVDLSQHAMPPNASVFKVAYDQIANHLDGGPLPHCTDDDWHVVNELGFAGIESALTGQRVTIPNQNRSRMVYANG